jgi:glycosyltransferase involved in cell wall biosynthesis
LKVAVNTRLLIHNRLEGIGYFTLKTLEHLVKNHPEVEFIFFFDRKYSKEFVFAPNITPVVIPCPTRLPILWYLYFEYLLPYYIKKYKADILFSPDTYIPRKSKVPTLNTFHDINYEYNPKYIGNYWHRRYYLKFFPQYAKKSTRLICVSKYSKGDIMDFYDIAPSKIDVIYNAANEAYYQVSVEEKEKAKQELTQGKDYFYFVGAIHKRKNLINLFKAFDIFKENTKSDVKLVVVGTKKWWKGEMENCFKTMKHKDDVIFTGRLEAEKINLIANCAIALTFVSLFEGFGIPIVEAFAAGCPVITSNTTSMPEVGGDAALYCDPYLAQSIAEKMEDIYNNPSLRAELIEKGFEQNRKFSWEKSAQMLWNAIQKTINVG